MACPDGRLGQGRDLDPVCDNDPMSERSRKRKPTDLNQLAAAIVNEATDEDAPEPDGDGKDPHAVALGRKGGLKGGPARANALTPERRREIAQKAIAARWAKTKAESESGD
jgi:hypothetical protein